MLKLKHYKWLNLFVIIVVLINTSGCTHALNIKNLDEYYNSSLASLDEEIRIGIKATATEMSAKKIVKSMAEALSKYNARATTVTMGNNSNVDVVAAISVNSKYKGSGMNFLINFPGFIIFAPAWHGYIYKVNHDITISLTDADTNKQLGTINLPVALNVRHADMNRTWTEISWFEVGVIALIGGIVFIGYDEGVTSLVSEKASPVLADYLAQDIVNILAGYRNAEGGYSFK